MSGHLVSALCEGFRFSVLHGTSDVGVDIPGGLLGVGPDV